MREIDQSRIIGGRKGRGMKYYSETIVPRMSFRHVYPDIVKLETELAEARAEIERLRQELRDNSTLAARQIVPAEMLVDDLTAEIERKDKLIEQMLEALKAIDAIGSEKGDASRDDALRCFSIARAALAAERGE